MRSPKNGKEDRRGCARSSTTPDRSRCPRHRVNPSRTRRVCRRGRQQWAGQGATAGTRRGGWGRVAGRAGDSTTCAQAERPSCRHWGPLPRGSQNRGMVNCSSHLTRSSEGLDRVEERARKSGIENATTPARTAAGRCRASPPEIRAGWPVAPSRHPLGHPMPRERGERPIPSADAASPAVTASAGTGRGCSGPAASHGHCGFRYAGPFGHRGPAFTLAIPILPPTIQRIAAHRSSSVAMVSWCSPRPSCISARCGDLESGPLIGEPMPMWSRAAGRISPSGVA